MQKEPPQFLTPAEVVTRWGNAVTTGTLANWRSRKEGPPFQKFGSRVRYPLASLVVWEGNNAHLAVPANDNGKSTAAA